MSRRHPVAIVVAFVAACPSLTLAMLASVNGQSSSQAAAATAVAPPAVVSGKRDLEKLQKRLRRDIGLLTGASPDDRVSRPKLQTLATTVRTGYEVATFTMPVDGGVSLGTVSRPS